MFNVEGAVRVTVDEKDKERFYAFPLFDYVKKSPHGIITDYLHLDPAMLLRSRNPEDLPDDEEMEQPK